MKHTILTVLMTLLSVAGLRAQDFTPILNNIINSYTPWTSAEFSGKVKTDKLPVSPTIKMYMVRDSLIQISARVPLLGEVGRVTLTKDRILAVNKMKKTYSEESSSKLFEMYPTFLADLQSIFLARVVVLGAGELSSGNVATVDIQADGNGSWLVLPQTDPAKVPFTYGYLVGANSRTLALMGAMADKGTLEILYSYRDRGEQMAVTLDTRGKKTELQIEFSSVKWGGSEMSAIRTVGYKKLSLKEFLGSLK